ncbi:hypothetical protein AVEN_92692-1 [Araneus ventricosus]|uniref:SMB domain-containing protein n=1 Tax=Araneus ventricosus TaxID=182803 RepID=A0A4Y2HMR1_ARAVE|nr:hypothetical protein AVEN_92692-1 [Araneus ventricosus]
MLPSPTLLLLTFLFIGQAYSSDTSERGEDCTAFDRCKSGDLFRTCSCDSDCYKYATCCSDSDKYDLMASEKTQYFCHTDRSATPVYAKKSCSDSYSGHESHTQVCHEAISDKADILGNLLVTSTKTKITYWNQDCAICNNEKIKDLKHWAVQVACPSNHGDLTFSKSYIEDHLTYDLDLEEWGLKVKDGFVVCTITSYQPTRMVGKLNYCAPNLVSKCPEGYSDDGILAKCLSYHAERKQKDTHSYFRNPHCALCNGVPEDELECVGRNYAPLNYAKGKDLVKVVFDSGEWLDRNASEKYKCSNGNMYDPFQSRCREFPESILRDLNYTLYHSGGLRVTTNVLILAISALIVLCNKYYF